MTAIRLAVFGSNGRMGLALRELLPADMRFQLSALIVSEKSQAIGQRCAMTGLAFQSGLTDSVDVVLDVSMPMALPSNISAWHGKTKAVVSGVTGFSSDAQALLDRQAQTCALLHTHNFSRGITVMRHLVREAKRLLGAEYQVGVMDIHHQAKQDAPSGTALSIDAALRQAGAIDVQHASFRLAQIPGTHTVHFAGANEHLEFKHQALQRRMFAQGALDAAAWLARKAPGAYTMEQVFGIAPQ